MQQNIIRKIKPSPLSYLIFYLVGGFIAIAGIFLNYQYLFFGLAIVLLSELLRRAHTYYITKDGVEYEFSFILRSAIFVKYDKIQDLTVNQGFWDRILDLGVIKINTAGSPRTEVELRGVKDPDIIKEIIKKQLK